MRFSFCEEVGEVETRDEDETLRKGDLGGLGGASGFASCSVVN